MIGDLPFQNISEELKQDMYEALGELDSTSPGFKICQRMRKGNMGKFIFKIILF